MPGSEIAQLKAQIEAVCESMRQAMYGPAMVASHITISHRYEQLGQYEDRLKPLVGEKEAIAVVTDTYIRIIG